MTQIWFQPLYSDLSSVQLPTSVYRQLENKQAVLITYVKQYSSHELVKPFQRHFFHDNFFSTMKRALNSASGSIRHHSTHECNRGQFNCPYRRSHLFTSESCVRQPHGRPPTMPGSLKVLIIHAGQTRAPLL